jgi:hypothetical protein
MNMEVKNCNTCNVNKSFNSFYKDRAYKDGYRGSCKSCKKIYNDRPETKAALKVRNNSVEYKEVQQKRVSSLEFKIKRKLIQSTDEFKAKNNLRKRNRLKVDDNYRLRENLRSRLNKAINNNQKVGSAVSDLGCSIEELKSYLENQFTEGMSWGNWSRTGWHMDHKTALAKFDLTNPEEFKMACHYTNLQPMWAKDNLKKGIK